MTAIRHSLYDSPIGPLRIAASDAGLVAIYMSSQRHVADDLPPHWLPVGVDDTAQASILDSARRQLDAYFAGRLTSFDLPLAPVGTEFQRTVWRGLSAIGYGETISYGELARRIGAPQAVRAVGLANGRNPISIVVPCHRVIGADGSMTGYGGGIDRKVFLLGLEQRALASDANRPNAQPFALV